MDKKNKTKLIVAIIALVAVCLFAGLVFSGVIDLAKITEEETTDPYEGFISDSYTNDITATQSNSLPYLKTNIENIFYTMDADGGVKFYKLADNAFTQVDSTGVYTTSVVLSETKITADITYYKDGDEICGYGVSVNDDGYTLYPYVLFCLRSYGEDYTGSSSSSCLLLIDTTQEDFYSNDKIFEESFVFKYSDSSATRSISEASRTVGISGAKRDDYFLINDTTVENSVANQLFFSGRFYKEADATVDIMRTGGSGNNTDNIRVAQNVLEYWLYNDGTDITYITVDESGNVVVEKLNWKTENTETVKTFEGVTKDDILVDGDYMYINGKNIIYNLVNNTQITLAYGKANALKADTFVSDGENIFIRGYVKEQYPVGIIANGETGKVSVSYANEIFKNAVNPVVLSNGQLMFTVEASNLYTYYVF